MKLVIAISHDRAKLGDALTDAGFSFTKLGSTGGFLRQGSATLLVGVEDADVERVLSLIKTACVREHRFVNIPGEAAIGPGVPGAFPPHPVQVEAGGAVAFVVAVESFHTV